MSLSLVRTRPGTELRMGVLLRDALAFQGVSVRVDKPWRSLPSEYLVAEREGHTPVWIHAASCSGADHYDIPRAELMAVAAVITDDVSTRFVYNGFSDEDARPVQQAEAMAAAVARHFDLPIRELPDPFGDVAQVPQSGYTPCACRDCMDSTVSSDMSKPELCSECKRAGCVSWPGEIELNEFENYECQREDAYGN